MGRNGREVGQHKKTEKLSQQNVFADHPVQTGDMKRRPGNGIEGAMGCTSLGSLMRPLFYFLDDVSYPQSVVYFFLGEH